MNLVGIRNATRKSITFIAREVYKLTKMWAEIGVEEAKIKIIGRIIEMYSKVREGVSSWVFQIGGE